MDEHKLRGLTELGHGVGHVDGHVIGDALSGPFPIMGGPRLLYLPVGLGGVGDCSEDLWGGNHQEQVGVLASWQSLGLLCVSAESLGLVTFL